MKNYQDMLRFILEKGSLVPTRAKVYGRPVRVLSVIGYQMTHDLSDSFPLVTTKRMAKFAIVRELLWFISGSTNVKPLQEQGVSIWDAWADENGDLGPIYGKQWRSWTTKNGRSIDQLKAVIKGIEETIKDPSASVSRRLIVSAWNVADIGSMKLPPCHVLFQFFVRGGYLHCKLYQRSADAFLGVPFNIASYALLTCLVARHVGLKPGVFIHSFGDLHIYENHISQCKTQLNLLPYNPPRIKLEGDTNIFNVKDTDITFVNYYSHGPIKGDVAV